MAFVGPAVASIESDSGEKIPEKLPRQWQSTGLLRGSYLRRRSEASDLLARLEDMAATMRGRVGTVIEIQSSHSDMLRDLRLAMLAKDDASARRLLDDIRLTGQVSAENLRFLNIEYLAAFGRWTEMRTMPHIDALVKVRRPRVVTESILQMIWWTELAGQGALNPCDAFVKNQVSSSFGSLLRSVRVPSTSPGRTVAMLTAVTDGDFARRDAILSEVQDHEEEQFLRAIAFPVDTTRSADQGQTEGDPTGDSEDVMIHAFKNGRYGVVLDQFVDRPSPDRADIAVQSVLEVDAEAQAKYAGTILTAVRTWASTGLLEVDRRLHRDLEDLERTVDGTCGGWLEWSRRLEGETRWADASSVLRNQLTSWGPLNDLTAQQIEQVAESILNSVDGKNEDQLRSSLDVLCRTASTVISNPAANDFCQVVLEVLSEQDNLSEQVRSAYLDLYSAMLESGPTADHYRDIVHRTSKVWMRIASPHAADWAIAVLEVSVDTPCPDPGQRSVLGVQVIEGIRQYYGRLGLRQRVEMEALAPDFGLVCHDIKSAQEERNVWSKADGTVIGLYSLLPRAVSAFEMRLAQLCQPKEVAGNADTVSTPALRSLAERADYLIVDTWHAAHQATGAIDSVRKKDRQILPPQRGISGFLRALEESLGS